MLVGELVKINPTKEVGLKDIKRLGYSECKIYQYNYKFGKPNVEGKILKEYVVCDKEENSITEYFLSGYLKGGKKVFRYEGNNKLSESNWYDKSGDMYGNAYYVYNDKGQLVKEGKRRNYDARDWEARTFEYQDNGSLLIEEKWVSNGMGGDLWLGAVYKYNDLGLLKEEIRYRKPGILWTKELYEYDDKNSKIKIIWYDGDGELSKINTYQNNDRGLEIECVSKYAGRSGGNSRRVSNYNDIGLVTDYTSYDEENKRSTKTEYKYDDRGSIAEVTYFDDKDEIIFGCKYKYNDKDLLIEKTKYGSMKEPLTTVIYEFE